MRYSDHPKFKIQDVHGEQRPPARGFRHDDFFEQIAAGSSAQDREGGVLLVGGTSAADLAVRQAQSSLRLDRQPSSWSHAAIILSWPDGARLDQVLGAEVALRPEEPDLQVPERNGVTLFRLSRYRNHVRFPNLAFGTLRAAGAERRKQAIVEAVLHPMRDRLRYPLFEWLGAWQAHVHGSRDNPLGSHLAHPGAALCDYAYASAGLDITPGADAPDTCPEMLWSTLLYWYPRLAKPDTVVPETTKGKPPKQQGAKTTVPEMVAWVSRSRTESLTRTAQPSDLVEEFEKARGPKTPSRR